MINGFGILLSIFIGLIFRRILFSLVLFFAFMGAGASDLSTCLHKVPLIEGMQRVTCATSDLRQAVQRDNLLRKVSQTNPFATVSAQDIVRSEESLSLFNQSLKDRIEETHQQYQESGTNRYTLSIASYPAQAKQGTCSRQKTIDFDPSASKEDKLTGFSLFGDDDEAESDEGEEEGESKPLLVHYTPLPEKTPRSFHVRRYKKKWVMCEKTDMDYSQRLSSFCGPEKKGATYTKCKKSLSPSCEELDKKGAKSSGPSLCVSMKDFASLSQDLLMSNTALEWKYCPGDCSYYTQTVQAFYKNGKGKYCSDSYLIVHCGPKRKASQYNLNIKEINDLCRDFESCTYI